MTDNQLKDNDQLTKIDSKELELPETSYIRDIETKVFQGIVLKCLDKIDSIGFIEGNIIDSLLGRETDRIKGIQVEQDQKKHSVFIRVEVNIKYGISIPLKAEEIQNKIIEEITELTGLHVSSVHVIFKNLIHDVIKKEEPKAIPDERVKEIEEQQEEYTHGC